MRCKYGVNCKRQMLQSKLGANQQPKHLFAFRKTFFSSVAEFICLPMWTSLKMWLSIDCRAHWTETFHSAFANLNLSLRRSTVSQAGSKFMFLFAKQTRASIDNLRNQIFDQMEIAGTSETFNFGILEFRSRSSSAPLFSFFLMFLHVVACYVMWIVIYEWV